MVHFLFHHPLHNPKNIPILYLLKGDYTLNLKPHILSTKGGLDSTARMQDIFAGSMVGPQPRRRFDGKGQVSMWGFPKISGTFLVVI